MKRWFWYIARVLGITFALATVAFLVSWWRVPPVVDDGSQTAISLRIEDRQGQALLRQVGVDEQWREPIALESMGCHLPAAVMAVEDERFLTHLGVDPIATTRAVFQISGMPKWFRGPAPSPCRSAKCSIPRPGPCGPNGLKPFGH